MTEEGILTDPLARFCEIGVEPGDWVLVDIPLDRVPDADEMDQSLVVESSGLPCATTAPTYAQVQMRIESIGSGTLTLKTADATWYWSDPTLDTSGIDNEPGGPTLAACEAALSDALVRDQRTPQPFDVAGMPTHFSYNILAHDAWVAVGSRSGYLHPQRWQENEDGVVQCTTDPSLDPRMRGRITETYVAYEACPSTGQEFEIAALTDAEGVDPPFSNFSFKTYMFQGCSDAETQDDTPASSRRGTRWSFSVFGPDSGRTINLVGGILSTRTPIVSEKRQTFYVDTAGHEITLVEIRPEDSNVIETFR